MNHSLILKLFSRFSINFAVDCAASPSNIAYHFKTIFTTNREEATIHNYKRGTWGMETVEENTWINGPGKPIP